MIGLMADAARQDATRDEEAQHRLGVLLVIASTLAFSTTGFFTRLIPLDAWTILFWRGIFSALFIGVYVVWEHRRETVRVVYVMGWPGWVLMLAYTVAMIAYIPALKLTSVANATLIAATAPFATALLAWAWLRERPSMSALLASAVAFLGVALMMGGSTGAGSHWGDLLALVSNFAFAAAMVVIRWHRAVPLVSAAWLATLLGSGVSAPFASPWSATSTDLVYLALFGFFHLTLGLTCFTIGSRLIPAVETALLGALDAPLGPLWVWLAFGEVPAAATFYGGAMVLAAVLGQVLAEARLDAARARSR